MYKCNKELQKVNVVSISRMIIEKLSNSERNS